VTNGSILILFEDLSRVEIFVNSSSTESSVSLELLNGGFCPSSESAAEIRERGAVVVVSIPDLLAGSCWASLSASHNGLPHISRRVYGRYFSMIFDSVDGLDQEVAVSVVV